MPPRPMTRAQFRHWLETEATGRYERVAGRPVAMAPERVGHIRMKYDLWLAFRRAILAKGLACEALGDGITVEIDDDTDYEPDVLINCGPRLDPDAVSAPNPVVIVEVISRSCRALDTGAKLSDYFRVPSVIHYLVVHTDRRVVVHHHRRHDGEILTRIISDGTITLDPPGIAVEMDDVYPPAAAGV